MACFPYPAAGTLGNMGRNQVVGPGLQNFDFSIYKNSNIFHERVKAQFRAEFFNIFNHANFRSQYVIPYSFTGNNGTGTGSVLPASSLNSNLWFGATVTTSRQIQFGLKFIF